MDRKYFASGKSVTVRLWNNGAAGYDGRSGRRDYETMGYVIAGCMELCSNAQSVPLGRWRRAIARVE